MAQTVYIALAEHQLAEDWELREVLADLRRWERVFNAEFKLELPLLSIAVDYTRVSRLGHFRRGHNGFGLWGEVVINRRHLRRRPPWMTLGTLLHEMLHAWQELHGTPSKSNYHNAEFRSKAAECGLDVDAQGHTQYLAPSLFARLLNEHGVAVPEQFEPMNQNRRGSSKLRKWSCGCTNVRVAFAGELIDAIHADFRARCLRCDNDFALQDQ